MNPIGRLFQSIIGVLNVMTSAALMVAAFSDFVSPARAVFFSYLGLFFPLLFIINLGLFAFWLFAGQWKAVGLNLLVFLVCINAIHTYFPIHRETETLPEGCIKILTYNVMRFGYPATAPAVAGDRILQYILENDADIICIQEFGAMRRSNGTRLTEKNILAALRKYPYRNIMALKSSSRNELFGIAIFSRYPVLSARKVPYASEYNGSVVYELDIHGQRVTLINNHLESNKLSYEERTDYYRMTQDPAARSLDVFTKMMTKRLTPAYRLRAVQAQIISRLAAENTNPYLVVCGDFNDTPISYARRKIKGKLRDAFVDSGYGFGITYHLYRFLFRIDYILHSSNIKSYNCTVGRLRGL
jgi:endonuclease/exonuclease/phosphatase family metal-dependent hydrolase